MTVSKANGLTYLLGHADFLARTVDEVELTIREENGEGDAGESATRAEVEDTGAWTETDHLGDGERVKHMVLIELVDVLAGYDVDLSVPFVVKGVKGLYLFPLTVAEVRKVMLYDICLHVD
jgi:hypothetical protein